MSSEPEIIRIKKRNRPSAPSRARTRSPGTEGTPGPGETSTTGTPAPELGTPADSDEEKNLPIDELIELRRLRRARRGIEVSKLNSGGPRKKKGKGAEDGADGATTTPEGLIKAERRDIDDDEANEETKARRAVRTSNFTQQTNALDVDKHMMAYIEQNINKRRGDDGLADKDVPPRAYDPQEELYKLPEKFRTQPAKPVEEGNVTNSLAMLTAIPEVDLGMDARLKNIEETEKAKQALADVRREHRNTDEERLAATRFFKPNLRQKSDADIVRDAKLEAIGRRPDEHTGPRRHHNDRQQTATDEMVMERFKKRMRR